MRSSLISFKRYFKVKKPFHCLSTRKWRMDLHEYVNYASRISIMYLRNAHTPAYISKNTGKFRAQRMSRHIVKRARHARRYFPH